MCKRISPSMALGFALQKRDRVSSRQLLEKSKKLLRMGDGFLLDVSHRTIARTVESHADVMEIVLERSSFSVVKKRAAGRLFNASHLRMCYEAAFTGEEFKTVRQVLIEV